MPDYPTQHPTSKHTMPRLAFINDIAGFGRCSTTVALPVISVMEVQVCPVPTAVLSNHLGFPLCHIHDFTPFMRQYIDVWKQLHLEFDGLYCGFLGNVEQTDIVEEFAEAFNPPIFLLDPVMGDHGKLYSTITSKHCENLKKLASHAQILTPNITEACLLADMPYKKNGWIDTQLEELCGRLSEYCPGKIAITGLQTNSFFTNIIWQDGKMSTCTAPRTGASRPGTGDLFASILIADALHGRDFSLSVQKAADFVAQCIQGSENSGTPIQEGVIFEKYLYQLVNQSE